MRIHSSVFKFFHTCCDIINHKSDSFPETGIFPCSTRYSSNRQFLRCYKKMSSLNEISGFLKSTGTKQCKSTCSFDILDIQETSAKSPSTPLSSSNHLGSLNAHQSYWLSCRGRAKKENNETSIKV